MQKIVIKNFGAIEYAEIEIKKVLVLIGEQASGKSTIAKLIYFFKSLKENLKSESFLFAQEKIPKYTDIDTYFREFIKIKFYDFFGSTLNFLNFEVRFYYSFQKNRYIQLNLDLNKNLCLIFSENFLDEQFKNGFADYINLSKKNIDNSEKPYIKIDNLTQYSLSYQYLSKLLNNLFENEQEDLLFIIAGRNATVTYSDLFEKYLFASIEIDLKENSKKYFANKLQMIDEFLMLQFIEKVELIKQVFRKFSGFDGLINYQANKKGIEYLRVIKNKIDLILKGEYLIGNSEEKIIFNKNERYSIDLRNASSGQQECIRILQDIFLNIIYDSIILRIIEEPEAHLFPVAQKHLIELLAIMVNRNEDNQLIITTHSPYILSVFNNLLFAKRVVEKNPSAQSEVSEIIPEDSWLNAAEFSAYSLGNQSLDEEANYCESIFDSNTGLIAQNYLDTVSEMMGGEFNKLYNIHARTFKRK